MSTLQTPPASSVRISELEPRDVQRLLREDRIILVDVREADEHRQERIDGATNRPSSGFDPNALPKDERRTLVLHCRSGRRSFAAAERLLQAGHPAASHMRGGIDAWKAAGLPTTVDSKAPFTAMQQTQIAIGLGVLASVVSGAFWTPWALILAGFLACGMIFAGATGTCGLATLIAKAPWNRSACGASCSK